MFDLVVQILTILAPAAILACIGVAWALSGNEYPIQFITNLITNVGMPALLFHTLTNSPVELASLGIMFLASLLVQIIAVAGAIVLLKNAGKDWHLCVALVMGNTGNLGLPICYFAFGDVGLAYGMAYFSVQCVLMFSIGEAILSGSSSVLPALKSPILHSLWLAALVNYLGFEMPGFLSDTTKLLGQFVIPIMLITLGVSLANLKVNNLSSTLKWSLIRTALALATAYFVVILLGLEGVAKGVVILETVMPVAVFNFLLAVRHNRDSVEISGLILVTHLSAIFYLPILLALLLA